MDYKIGDVVYVMYGSKKVEATVVDMFPESSSVRKVVTQDGIEFNYRPGNRHILGKVPALGFKVGDVVFFKEPRKVRSRYLEGTIVSVSGKFVTISCKTHAFTVRSADTVFHTLKEAKKRK